MTAQGIGIIGPDGFKGHGCAFCGGVMPVDLADQFPMSIVLGGQRTHFWAHRDCLRSRVTPNVQKALDRLPPATPDDVLPRRPA